MPGRMHIYRAGFMKPETQVRNEPLSRDEAKKILGNGCEIIEVVHVLFNGRRAQMLVDEDYGAKDLPTNWDATDIYMAATRAGKTSAPQDAPTHWILGTAIVLESPSLWWN